MKHSSLTGVSRLRAAFANSVAGLRDMWRREEAFRQECLLLAAAVPLAFWLGSGAAQIGLLIGSVLLLIIVEILNSAIEAVVDRVGLEWHELSRVAKDLGSAAVLLAALFPAGVWGLVLLSRLDLVAL